MNFYHDLAVRGADIVTFDASFMRDIEYYFSSKANGDLVDRPKQFIPPHLPDLLISLRLSTLTGRFEAASIFFSMDATAREGGQSANAPRCRQRRGPSALDPHAFSRCDVWHKSRLYGRRILAARAYSLGCTDGAKPLQ